jgi:hypothetical protein
MAANFRYTNLLAYSISRLINGSKPIAFDDRMKGDFANFDVAHRFERGGHR